MRLAVLLAGSPSIIFLPSKVGKMLSRQFTLKKIRVFQAGFRRNTLAWNNGIGLWSVVGFWTIVMINRDRWGH